MFVVNLFGGPGCGKSTMAAYIFSKLKMQGVNCELVTEFAKDKTWEQNEKALACQPYIFGNQCYKLDKLQNQVDVVITDSPIFLATFYGYRENIEPEFSNLVVKKFNTFKNLNFFLKRYDKNNYVEVGRNQDKEEANQLDDKIKAKLNELKIEYYTIDGDTQIADTIVIPKIINTLGKEIKK